ncbi:MAG: hypothetical protein GOVbin2917_34 [Prokaryotic dsDNA virus sp.]|jgi:hypothetical protein|nr:MAG: hypothetical protein GOVbin2917_34 [Prokaryotic dsDNA virus sp.]|tara:strand:- start:82275 stop:82640 length:366 start_codon:yes stop_codon:yes gene_type:complete
MSELNELEDKVVDMVVEVLTCNKYYYYINYQEKELCVKNCNWSVILRIHLNDSCDGLDNSVYLYDREEKSLHLEKPHPLLADVVKGKCQQIKKERERKLLENKVRYLTEWSSYLENVGGLK